MEPFDHLEMVRQREAAIRERDGIRLCVTCGEHPIRKPKVQQCWRCRERKRQSSQALARKVAAGLCAVKRCPFKSIGQGRYCIKHNAQEFQRWEKTA